MQNILGAIRYSFRQFRHAPVFTVAAVLTLALGIGGTTAIFSLVDSVMLRSLPVVDPGSLYRVGSGNDCCVQGGPQDQWGMFSYPLYQVLQKNLPEFEAVTAFQAGPNRMSVRRESERTAKPLRSEFVTGTYFSTLGIRAFGGRLFTEKDDQPSAAPVAVLSYQAWKGAYGGDPSIVGSTFVIQDHAFTIIGVAPPGFFGETLRGEPPQIWVPLQQEPMINGEGSLVHQSVSAWLRVIGRLRPGATTAGMAPRLTSILREWLMRDSGYPANWLQDLKRVLPKQTIEVVPAGAGVEAMKDSYGRSLEILFAVCGVVLLIACANVANLMLARAASRRAQTAVRLALGASRREIVKHALIESVLLSLMGGVAGLAVAVGASRLLLDLAFHSAKFLPISTSPSLLVLAFAFVVSLITGIVFGGAPAWFATRTHPVEALRGAGRSTHDTTSVARKTLLVVQATLSVVLVAGATMLGRSLGNLEHQNLGYQSKDRISVELNSPPATYTQAQLQSLYRQIEDKLRAMPGVKHEGLALYNPLTDNWGEMIMVQGHPLPQFNEDAGASWDRITPGYFATLGQPILRGRGFTEADNDTAAQVAVVNETFVKRFFPHEDPLEKHFGLDLPENAGTYTIVGIVADAKYASWTMYRPALPMFYVPMAQSVKYANALMEEIDLRSHFVGGIMLETGSTAGAVQGDLTKMFASIDPNLTIIHVSTMQQQIADVFSQERAVASLAGLFGIVALLLAAVGLYGVTAYSVAQRTNEIGIRMALGAGRTRVVQLVLQSAFRRVAVGLLLGVPLAIGAGKLIATQLYGVKTWDPVALTIAVVALGLCAFIAAVIPALRAAAISPIEALRME
ncbi:MAG: ABC transporter permease [Candidatus Acidiferrales bacterium]